MWDSGSGTSKRADDSSTTRKWGIPSPAMKDATAGSPKRSSSNNWTKKTTEGNSGGDSWGTTDTTGGWGAGGGTNVGWGGDTSVGWGGDTSVGWGGDTSVGWGGSGGGGDGGGGDSGAGLGSGGGGGGGQVGDNTSTIPSGNDRKGKGKESEDVEMREPSPSRITGSFKRITPLNRLESATPLPPTLSTPSDIVASKPIRPRPLPLPSKKKTQVLEDTSLKKLALQIMKKPDKEAEQVQEKSSSVSPKIVKGPKGRADLFSQVIK